MPPRISSKRRAADLSIVAATIAAVITAWAFIPKDATSTPSADVPTGQAFSSNQPPSPATISEVPTATVTTTPALTAQTRDNSSTQSPAPTPPPTSPPRRTQAAPHPATTPATTTPPSPTPPTTERPRPPRN
ncbi:MAG: hypothetical protein F2567_05810 [Actinobacteria bacterium]|nr:hypothetical protein [Actinomycetota bacterium]MSW31280.1 hypothetical protein [Actinomycetota bacterium]MSX34070.1 hypothetical protein [Actinomycetota bacterium]MSY24564.1 hypothetical protein [Actinomycetota bacterium]MTA42534.1 hypothetical protein [Actinomycetota bacterium]